MKPEDVKIVNEAIKELERNIGIHDGFFESLLKPDSDWSFVVKLHSFFEAVCSMLIIEALSKKELIEVISRLDMSDRYCGKIAFINRLSLLHEGARGFIRKLSELRNFYVHDIKNISLSLEDYIQKLDKNRLNNFITSIGYDTYEKIQIREIIIDKGQFIKENPKFAIYLGAFSVLAEITVQMKLQNLKFREEEFRKKAANFFITISEKLSS
jgi:hypothetical protein